MRIGILGGTFDPIHYGHIRPAMEVKAALGLDKILLMPNHIPPHKCQPHCTSAQRLEMVARACAELSGFELCDIEVKRDSPSYTVVTLKHLRERYPNDQLFFILGMDAFLQLPSWHNWQQLFDLTHFVLCERPGWTLTKDHPMWPILEQRRVPNNSRHLKEPPQIPPTGGIFCVQITAQDISSTDIRAQLARGKIPQDALLPSTVNYIQKQKLYQA
ncbi:nicotinate-nucleotide adenylyltransferase [Shewanella sp.]|uniref:nicotinate-nucleotide adenylyltransferase n=1 Tax=Shewanella sp. TaxID=50422 RepID=UPI003F33703A